jgi:hypothetical protein
VLSRSFFPISVLAVALVAAEPAPRDFNVPAGPAEQTLRQFLAQSGVQVAFPTDLVRGVPTRAVSGKLEPAAALELMLADTGLVLVRDAKPGSYAIRRNPDPNVPRAAPANGDRPLPSPAEVAAGGAVVLSPFTVTSDSAQGYIATQTLNGTRLNSALRDVGAAMTIFTEQLLDDLAANSVTDLAAFAPNTDPFVGNLNDTSGNGNAFLTTQAPQYVTRGGATALISQDFFSTPTVPPDRYNAENFTFTRGPNSILFGLGNPAGAFTSSTKRAQFRNAYSLEVRGDDHGGLRAVVDLNRVLVKRKLALRYAGLGENAEGFRDPSGNTQRRHFLTASFTPFRRTMLRVNAEQGELRTLAIRPWPAYDGITPWIDAGRPLLATAGSGRTPPPGIQNAYGAAAQSLVVTDNTRAGTVVPPMSWRNQGRSANPTFPNYPNLANFRSLLNPAILPIHANVIGEGSLRSADFRSLSAVWEQQLARDLFVELAFKRSMSEALVIAAFGGQNDRPYVDVNRQLPNGAPNPNVGMLYADSFANVLPNTVSSATHRAMLSYDLDGARLWPARAAWLGRHRLAAFVEDGKTLTWGSQNPSQNLTPLPGSPAAIPNLNNRVLFRYYLDPARGVTTAGFDATQRYPIVYAGDALPPRDPSGVTPGLVAIAGGTAVHTRLITRAIATQSSFWRGRLVGTFGWREDAQTVYRGTLTDFNPYRDARGIYPNPRHFEAKRHFPLSRQEGSGQTYTRGLVFHALPWLSLTYNESNNLQPNATQRDVAGRLLENPEGEGRDYGIKFNLFGGRIVGDVTYYKNFGRNRPDTTVANGLHGNFQNDINAIWNTLAARENRPEYQNNPYAYPFSNWLDVNTGYSDGYEASLTANFTPEWRFTINGSKRGPGETVDRGRLIRGYLAANLPLWKGNAAWLAAPLIDNTSGATIGTAVARLENTLANFDALASLPTDSLFAPEWSTNLITTYAFARTSRLKGIAVGASANLRGRTVIGFEENASAVAIADRPYYADGFVNTGAWISYRRKIFRDKIDWRLQLNVRNVADADTIFPHRAVDRRDGTGRPEVVIYRLNEPRTFVLTSAFSF